MLCQHKSSITVAVKGLLLSVTRIARKNAIFNISAKSISTLNDSTIWFKEMFLYFTAKFGFRVTTFKTIWKAIPE